MHTIWIIIKKELMDTLRDRRTLLMAIVLPLVLIPLLLGGIVKLQTSQFEEASARTLRVGLAGEGTAPGFAELLRERGNLRLYEAVPADSARALVRRDSLDAVFVVGADFEERIGAQQPGGLTLVFESNGDGEVQQERLRALVETYRAGLLEARLAQLDLAPTAMQTVTLEEVNVATEREVLGQLIGGFLPYIFLIFCFLGAMYPAIDLGAGEKERHTMETLLTSPASRMQIALGKFFVITGAGIVSALVSIAGLAVGLQLVGDLPDELMDTVQSVLAPGAVLLVILLLVPLAMFFAGLQLALSVFAKSFKEAQSILSPLSFLAIVPAAIGMLPGIELTTVTALIPVLNVSLAAKAIMAGTIQTGELLLVVSSLLVLAAASLYLCTFQFRREQVIFRT